MGFSACPLVGTLSIDYVCLSIMQIRSKRDMALVDFFAFFCRLLSLCVPC